MEIIQLVPGKDFLRHKQWSLTKSNKLFVGGEGGDVLPVFIARGALKEGVISDVAKLSLAGSDVAVKIGSRTKSEATLAVVYGEESLFETEGLTLGSYVSSVTWSYRFAGRTSVFALFVRIMSPGESLSLFVEGAPFLIKKTEKDGVIIEFA